MSGMSMLHNRPKRVVIVSNNKTAAETFQRVLEENDFVVRQIEKEEQIRADDEVDFVLADLNFSSAARLARILCQKTPAN